MPPPQNPAQVSGPGPMSKRTDGGPAQALRDLPDSRYGENSQFQALQQGASLSASPSPQGQAQPFDASALPPNPLAGQVTPLSAPTGRPNEPVTAGAALGPGAGPEALGATPAQTEAQTVSKVAQSMSYFEMLANMNNADPSTRLFVNLLGAGGQK